jgi:site-specific recombinase XerD
LAAILRDLLEERQLGIQENSPVFVNAQGKRLTRFGLTHIVRRAVNKASK